MLCDMRAEKRRKAIDRVNDEASSSQVFLHQFKKVLRRALVGISGTLLIAFIALSILSLMNGSIFRSLERIVAATSDTSSSNENTRSRKTDTATPSPEVLGDSDTGSIGMLSSEQYRMGQVVLGGDVGVLSQSDQFITLAVSDIRGEALDEASNQSEGRVLITWRTNKAALSTLSYGKGFDGSVKVFEEDGYGFAHSVILSQLDLASTYLYKITVRDRSGNEVSSDSYAVYTGTKEISLFELIADALLDVFGWAVKK